MECACAHPPTPHIGAGRAGSMLTPPGQHTSSHTPPRQRQLAPLTPCHASAAACREGRPRRLLMTTQPQLPAHPCPAWRTPEGCAWLLHAYHAMRSAMLATHNHERAQHAAQPQLAAAAARRRASAGARDRSHTASGVRRTHADFARTNHTTCCPCTSSSWLRTGLLRGVVLSERYGTRQAHTQRHAC
jgi:hypothetical protein